MARPAQEQPPKDPCQACGVRQATVVYPDGLFEGRLCRGCALLIAPHAVPKRRKRPGRPARDARAIGADFAAMTGAASRAGPGEGRAVTWVSLDELLALLGTPDIHDRGNAAGRAWALHSATAEELDRLADYYRSLDREGFYPFAVDAGPGGPGGAGRLHVVLRPGETRPGAASAFWQAALDEANRGKERQGDFVVSFADGALGLWLERADPADALAVFEQRPRKGRRGKRRQSRAP